ncbi:MAG TPA: alpha-amylase family glycosyl hydrolase [Candidatus Saccharimonadales bacterium]|nr:alpha-amylase family glycosyl hydrolase [Candidatus Saccharimonadales bacterium]
MDKATWPQKAVIYQIYPRSFKDSNNDGIGDIQGIIQKLDYLVDLGIDAIWISPMYKSPMEDFGYDVSDYCDIEPMFGTLKDFDELIKKAHKKNIKIIMDFIPSHTSSQHPWFIESKSSKDNSKRDWYIWKDPKEDGTVPNNWLSVFGGSRWEYEKKTKQYYLHTFLLDQPDLNWRNPEVQKAMFDVLHFWLKKGVDGFRVDAFDHMYKDALFRDEPPNPKYKKGNDDPFESQLHIRTTQQPELYTMIKNFNEIVSAYEGDKFIVTESYVDLPALVKLYQAGTKQHAPFNFQFISLPWEAKVYKEFIDEFDKQIGEQYLPTYVLGNHDRSRVSSRIGQNGARVAALLQLTVRGVPTIYNGEEIGMEDSIIPENKVQDPFEKNVPGMGLGRDPERTPMQWTSGEYAGFSEVEPWLPIPETAKEINAAVEDNDPKSMLQLYKILLRIRRISNPLLFGTYTSLPVTNTHVFAYVREYEGEKILIVLNFSDNEQTVTLPYTNAEIIINTFLDKKSGEKIAITEFSLQPHEGYLLKIL